MAEEIGGTTSRTRLRRLPELGSYERASIYEIIDASPVAHVGTVLDGAPLVLPTLCVRDGDRLLLHGSRSSRLLRTVASIPSVCVSFTLVDGIIVARSSFNSSIAYRSAVVFGPASLIVDPGERQRALDVLIDGVIPGRSGEVRASSASELRRTSVLSVEIEEASAKVSVGPPEDEDEDIVSDAWAGVIHMATTIESIEPAPDGAVGRGEIPVPPSVRAFMDGP